jgi:hypothetical protein
VRLLRRLEFILDAKMQPLLAKGEPHLAEPGEIRRLFQFGQAEDA